MVRGKDAREQFEDIFNANRGTITRPIRAYHLRKERTFSPIYSNPI